MVNHLCLQEKMYICHIYSLFIHHVFSGLKKSLCISIFIPVCGRYIWEISQLALISVKILVSHGQISRLQLKFRFLPQLSIKFIFSNTVCAGSLGNFAFGPHFVQQFKVSCVAKWEISTISLTVWHVGYQSHGILGNFDIVPTKSVIS